MSRPTEPLPPTRLMLPPAVTAVADQALDATAQASAAAEAIQAVVNLHGQVLEALERHRSYTTAVIPSERRTVLTLALVQQLEAFTTEARGRIG